MFDDFDLYETCEEYYHEPWEDFPEDWEEEDWEEEDAGLDSYWESQTDLEYGFNPYMGCFDWDC